MNYTFDYTDQTNTVKKLQKLGRAQAKTRIAENLEISFSLKNTFPRRGQT